jgi:hypothetical protein
MVAVGDFGCAERERMVELAIEHGWIQQVAGWAVERGVTQPVVVLATTDCHTPPGPLGKIVEKAVAGLARVADFLQQVQRAGGCTPYTMFSLPLEVLCQLVDPGTADDLREAAAANEYAVLCINAGTVVLISGVSRTTEANT